MRKVILVAVVLFLAVFVIAGRGLPGHFDAIKGKPSSILAESPLRSLATGSNEPASPAGVAPRKGPYLVKRLDVLARVLGMSKGDLQSELRMGRTIIDIAPQRGLTLKEIRRILKTAN